VKYYAQLPGQTAFVTYDGQLLYRIAKHGDPGSPTEPESRVRRGWTLVERFLGALAPDVTGLKPSATTVSYFWRLIHFKYTPFHVLCQLLFRQITFALFRSWR